MRFAAHRRRLPERRLDLAPIDRATLAYLGVALAVTLVHGPREAPWAWALPLSIVLVALAAAFIVPRARGEGAAGRFLAEFYPLLLAPALYTQVGVVNAARGVSHDAVVQSWDQALFGAQPSFEWIRAFPSPAWSTLMHTAYLSYYAILAASPLSLWLGARREAARSALYWIAVTFYICYATFLAFPVAGPRYLLEPADNAATAVPSAVLTHALLERGSAWGTAFPSSHVAAALVAAGCAWRGSRPLGAVLLPLAALLSLATVYCQLHYAVDAIAGAVLAAAVLLVGAVRRGMMRRAGN